MSIAQHTPGPWIYDPKSGMIGYDEADCLSPVIKAHEPYALTSDEELANYQLIAAAPDMLAALESLTSLTIWRARGSEFDRRRLAAAQEAIAKAKGGAPQPWASLAGLRGTDARCTCTDAQLRNVGCDCDAEQNMPIQCGEPTCLNFLRSQSEIEAKICEACAA